MFGKCSLWKVVGLLLAACMVSWSFSVASGPSIFAEADETPAGDKQAKPRKPADNSECLVCHADFETETLSAKHAKAGTGCFDCHGPSTDHGDDEWNIVLPDVLFGRKEITPFCTKCHKKEDHPKGEKYRAFVKKWSGKYRPNGRMIRKTSICTDCHGNHAVLSPDQQQFSAE